jgi:hypothetical protein
LPSAHSALHDIAIDFAYQFEHIAEAKEAAHLARITHGRTEWNHLIAEIAQNAFDYFLHI